MQSGISASQDLHSAFNTLVSTPSSRALIAGIDSERLIPITTLPSSSSSHFTDDLHLLTPHLTPTAAAYILLKLHPSDPNGYAAITYIPNAAPVRQKMLYASTRLTLVRELGLERFREQIFATEQEELTKEGWARHEAHEALAAPLTEEESGLRGVKDAEAAESQGTTARRGHVSAANKGVDLKTGEGVVEALSWLKEEGCRGTLVQLKFVLPDETLVLDSSTDGVGVQDVRATIAGDEPRYSFYALPEGGSGGEAEVVYIYTCPTKSKIKERMVYATGKSWTRVVAERDAGLRIARSLEATDPGDLDVAELGGSVKVEGAADETKPKNAGFARPKRPGRK